MTTKKGIRVESGNYYGERRRGGPLEPAPSGVPDFVVCRRVTDYAPAPIPTAAAFSMCSRCGARIAYNPKGPHQSRPKICMQCAQIEPLPMESHT